MKPSPSENPTFIQSGATPQFDAAWKRETKAGNDAYAAGDFDTAAVFYNSALQEAGVVFARAWNGASNIAPHAAPMMVVSVGNAARNAMAGGKTDIAVEAYRSAVVRFLQAIEGERADLALKEACLEHLSRLVSNMMELCADDRDHGKSIMALAERAHEAGANHWRGTTH